LVAKLPYFTIATILWLVALLFGTLTPGNDLPDVGFRLNDKLIHLVIFLVLTVLFLKACKKEYFLKFLGNKVVFFVIIIVLVLSIGTELAQHFIPGRRMGIDDMVADIVGVVLALGVFKLWK